eukprot:137900-Chlamydomonas_euryale.AAC.2
MSHHVTLSRKPSCLPTQANPIQRQICFIRPSNPTLPSQPAMPRPGPFQTSTQLAGQRPKQSIFPLQLTQRAAPLCS